MAKPKRLSQNLKKEIFLRKVTQTKSISMMVNEYVVTSAITMQTTLTLISRSKRILKSQPILNIKTLIMDIVKFKQLFVLVTKDIHKMELIAKGSEAFKSYNFPFKSPRLQVAVNEIEKARMCAGDCLRLIILGEDARFSKRFIPSEHGATCTDDLNAFMRNPSEKEVILDLKSNLRDILYRVLDAKVNAHVFLLDCSPAEFDLYCTMLKTALKSADQQLGLRLGELV